MTMTAKIVVIYMTWVCCVHGSPSLWGETHIKIAIPQSDQESSLAEVVCEKI